MQKKKALAAVCALLMAVSAGASLTLPVRAAADTAVSQSMQNYINEVAALVNQERAAQGLNALQLRTDLNQAAEVRSQEIVTQFSHTRPDGRGCSTVLDDNQISWKTTGENIAYGYNSPEAVMNGWMHSSGHRANILNADFDSIGIGIVSQNGTLYWTQIFTGGTGASKTNTVSVPELPEKTDTYTVPSSGTDFTLCTGDDCTNGTCMINGQNCNTKDVLSALTQNCSGGNCVINGQNCNTKDVLSALTQNCANGNCNIFNFCK